MLESSADHRDDTTKSLGPFGAIIFFLVVAGTVGSIVYYALSRG